MTLTERGVRPPLRVGVILAQHFTLSAFAVFIDHLRLAADEGDRSRPLHVQWSIMANREESVPASCGVSLEPTSGFLPPDSLDYVVVIGGILHAGPQVDEATLRYLREVGSTNVPLDRHLHGQLRAVPCGPDEGPALLRQLVSLPGFSRGLSRPTTSSPTGCSWSMGRASPAPEGRARRRSPRSSSSSTWAARVAQKASQVLLFDRPRSGSEAQPHPPCRRR